MLLGIPAESEIISKMYIRLEINRLVENCLFFSSSKIIPNRLRRPRCVMGPTGLLPLYSVKQSLGQELLYTINHHNYSEVLVSPSILMICVFFLKFFSTRFLQLQSGASEVNLSLDVSFLSR